MYQYVCAWCRKKFGEAKTKNSHGLCKACYDLVLAEFAGKNQKTRTEECRVCLGVHENKDIDVCHDVMENL